MKIIILCLTFVLLFHRIHGDASYEDLNGTFTLIPKWRAWDFCSEKLRVEARGNEIDRMIFNENDTACDTENLSFEQKTSSSEAKKEFEGVFLHSRNRTVCGGNSVRIKLRKTLQPWPRDPVGGPEGESLTLVAGVGYLQIYTPKTDSCMYKSDKPAASPEPVPSLSPLPAAKKPQAPARIKKTSNTVWVWLGPVIGAILAIILAGICLALVKDRLCCGPKPAWHTPFFQRG